MPGVVRGHHIGLLALLRSSRAHNSLLSICRARHAPDVRGMQQADVMVKRSNASGCGNVAAIKTARQVLGAMQLRGLHDHPGKTGAIKKREFAD